MDPSKLCDLASEWTSPHSCLFSRLSRDITGRAELQQATSYFVSSHTVLAKHLPPNHLLTTKILR